MRKILMNKDQHNYSVYKKKVTETVAAARGIVDEKYIVTMENAIKKMDDVIALLKSDMAAGKFLGIFANATPLQQAFTRLTFAWMHLWSLTIASGGMKALVGDLKGAEREKLLADNNEAAYYTGKVLSAQFYLGAEFQKYFGCADYILSGEGAVTKASSAIFTGALEE